VSRVILFAFTSAFNPTLLAVSTVMLLLPNPKRLMFGYLLGALMTSITLGCVIVFSLNDSSTTSTTQHSLSPAADVALGALALILAGVLQRGGEDRPRKREKKPKADKGPPRWQRALSRGSARTAFLVGAVLTLPGASYLAGLHSIHELHYSDAATVALIVGFNLIMLMLLEIPLLCFVVAPDWTPRAIERTKSAIAHHWRRYATIGLTGIGAALVLKGVLGFVIG
jgi:hypothetical protein